MTSKRNLKRRVADLATDAGGGDGPDEIEIVDSLVSERGADPEPFARTRYWRDEASEWRTERTEL